MRILKWPLKVAGLQTLEMPKYSAVIALQLQNGVPTLWAECPDSTANPVTRTVLMLMTGEPVTMPGGLLYIGTVQVPQGLVLHYYIGDGKR